MIIGKAFDKGTSLTTAVLELDAPLRLCRVDGACRLEPVVDVWESGSSSVAAPKWIAALSGTRTVVRGVLRPTPARPHNLHEFAVESLPDSVGGELARGATPCVATTVSD